MGLFLLWENTPSRAAPDLRRGAMALPQYFEGAYADQVSRMISNDIRSQKGSQRYISEVKKIGYWPYSHSMVAGGLLEMS